MTIQEQVFNFLVGEGLDEISALKATLEEYSADHYIIENPAPRYGHFLRSRTNKRWVKYIVVPMDLFIFIDSL